MNEQRSIRSGLLFPLIITLTFPVVILGFWLLSGGTLPAQALMVMIGAFAMSLAWMFMSLNERTVSAEAGVAGYRRWHESWRSPAMPCWSRCTLSAHRTAHYRSSLLMRPGFAPGASRLTTYLAQTKRVGCPGPFARRRSASWRRSPKMPRTETASRRRSAASARWATATLRSSSDRRCSPVQNNIGTREGWDVASEHKTNRRHRQKERDGYFAPSLSTQCLRIVRLGRSRL